MEAYPTPVINYFSGFKQNVVPLFQRPYRWTRRNWQALRDDISQFYGSDCARPATNHFLGAVVTMPARSVPAGVSKFLVIDGQQRLTTLALLFCALRDSLPNEHLARRKIQGFYLTNEGYEGLDNFKLLPTQSDRRAYFPLIHAAAERPDSQLKEAYEYYRRWLKSRDEEGNSIDPARILEIIETRLMVVMINLGDSDDPYLIFESLNFKGSPLEQADLVRNFFFMRLPAGEQQQVYDEAWLPMQQELGPALTDFMRHYLGAEGKEVLRGDVYAAIRQLVGDQGPAAVRLLMSRMARLAMLYSRIATPAREPRPSLREYFERFHRLDFSTAYPLILTLYEDCEDGQFGEGEFLACLAVLDSFIVRRMVVGVPSNSLAGTFVALCRSKPETEGPAAWLSGALAAESRNRRWPTDAEFGESWQSRPIYPNRACATVLELLESSFAHHEPASLERATIEHVMPQTLTAEWLESLAAGAAEAHARWVHTIGNLTLTGYNSELGNMPFGEKKAIFASSHFELNRYFAPFTVWGPTEIENRARALLDTALRLWPRPASLAVDLPAEGRSEPATFHADCVRAAERRLGVAFSKLSQTRYQAPEGGERLVCAVSAGHRESNESVRFWFSLHPAQLDFMKSGPAAWLCLGCGSAGSTLLVPVQTIEPLLGRISVTSTADRHYWHLVIQRRGEQYVMRLLGAADGPDLTPFCLRDTAASAR